MNKEKDDVLHYIKNMDTFFAYTRVIYWRVTVLELSKLFLGREKFSLHKILNKLDISGEYRSLKFDAKRIHTWKTELEALRPLINNLQNQRDNIYAHEDDPEDAIRNEASLHDVKELLKIATAIIREVDVFLLKPFRSFNMLNSPARNLHYVIQEIFQKRMMDAAILKQHGKDHGIEDGL